MRNGFTLRCLVATAAVLGIALSAGPALAKGPKPPKIKSVGFTGTPAEPTITVKGSGLGSTPTGEPAPACFSPSPTGENFGEGVASFVDEARAWAAGKEGDCIGLVIHSYTEKEVVFTLGSGYRESTYEPVQKGDAYEVTLHGVSHKGMVKFKK